MRDTAGYGAFRRSFVATSRIINRAFKARTRINIESATGFNADAIQFSIALSPTAIVDASLPPSLLPLISLSTASRYPCQSNFHFSSVLGWYSAARSNLIVERPLLSRRGATFSAPRLACERRAALRRR